MRRHRSSRFQPAKRRVEPVEVFRKEAELLSKLVLIEATLEDNFFKILRELHRVQALRKAKDQARLREKQARCR